MQKCCQVPAHQHAAAPLLAAYIRLCGVAGAATALVRSLRCILEAVTGDSATSSASQLLCAAPAGRSAALRSPAAMSSVVPGGGDGPAPRLPRRLPDALPFLILSVADRPGAPAFLGQVFTLESADGSACCSRSRAVHVRSLLLQETTRSYW